MCLHRTTRERFAIANIYSEHVTEPEDALQTDFSKNLIS